MDRRLPRSGCPLGSNLRVVLLECVSLSNFRDECQIIRAGLFEKKHPGFEDDGPIIHRFFDNPGTNARIESPSFIRSPCHLVKSEMETESKEDPSAASNTIRTWNFCRKTGAGTFVDDCGNCPLWICFEQLRRLALSRQVNDDLLVVDAFPVEGNPHPLSEGARPCIEELNHVLRIMTLRMSHGGDGQRRLLCAVRCCDFQYNLEESLSATNLLLFKRAPPSQGVLNGASLKGAWRDGALLSSGIPVLVSIGSSGAPGLGMPYSSCFG